MVGLHFVELLNDSGVVNRQAAELSKTLRCFVVFVHLDKVSRGLWEEEKSENPC